MQIIIINRVVVWVYAKTAFVRTAPRRSPISKTPQTGGVLLTNQT